jgi:hypothetical protein
VRVTRHDVPAVIDPDLTSADVVERVIRRVAENDGGFERSIQRRRVPVDEVTVHAHDRSRRRRAHRRPAVGGEVDPLVPARAVFAR